jgi:hypothetical protein
MKHIEFSASKGGVGTTTFSVALAIGLAKSGKSVLLVDTSKYGDCFAVYGSSVPSIEKATSAPIVEVKDNLSIMFASLSFPIPDCSANYDHIIYDAGVNGFAKYHTSENDTVYRIGVVTNEYVSLRNLTMNKNKYDAIVLFHKDEFALNAKDVAQLFGATPKAQMEYSAKTARSIDAGLLPSRYQDVVGEAFESLVSFIANDNALV